MVLLCCSVRVTAPVAYELGKSATVRNLIGVPCPSLLWEFGLECGAHIRRLGVTAAVGFLHECGFESSYFGGALSVTVSPSKHNQ